VSVQNKPTVLITGASSGIGRACASQMSKSGWVVLAGVRKQEDGEKVRQELGSELVPLIVDLEDRESIAEAAEKTKVLTNGSGLEGLVNVAGIGLIRPIEYVSAADLQKIFEVNVFGQIFVTQSFLPLIHNARGRIVNISSVGAHIAIPFGGLLNATKGAFGLLSDALRLELRPFGVRVSTVEPGSIKTPAVDKTLGNVHGIISKLLPGGAERYGQMLEDFVNRAYAREIHGSPPHVVAEAVHHALTARTPRIRYVVGKDAKLLTTLPRFVPDRVLDAIRLRLFGVPSIFRQLP
jgi:NAD(P)-dependent dehydrogenase (short-subunit alcohol dehydrogenase family)